MDYGLRATGYDIIPLMQLDPRSILVVDASHFGKALLILPAMQALRDAFPETYILTATSKGISELLKVFQLCDETVELGVIKPGEQDYASAIKRLLRLMRNTNRSDFDFVIDFAPAMETQIASRLGWRTRHVTPAKFSNFIDVLLKRKTVSKKDHATDCAVALKKIGINTIAERFAFSLSNEDSHRFEEVLKRGGFRGAEPVVVLYSSLTAQSWPLENFREIAFRLANNFAARMVMVDEPFTNDFTKATKTSLPKGTITIASPNAIDFLATLARASLVITDERGVAKTAGDLDAPVIELADAPSPSGESNSHRILRSSSRPRISTDEVYDLASEMIQEGRTPSLFRR
jgi:ADP-heptose:LPS heptosyltransferase